MPPEPRVFAFPEERARSHRWLALLFALGFLAVAGAVIEGLSAVGVGAGGYGPRAVVSELTYDPTNTPSPTPTATPTPVPTPTPIPKLTRASLSGLKIWSFGDSTSYFMTVALYDLATRYGAIPVRDADYSCGTGLLTSQQCAFQGGSLDWPSFAQQQMATYSPDIAVVMIGMNDAVGSPDPDHYRALIDSLMDGMDGGGRTVVWVGIPSIDPALRDAHMVSEAQLMNTLAEQEAAARPWVIYVDAWADTADANGNFTWNLVDQDGSVVEARAGDDGIHFTAAGGNVLAEDILNAILGE